MHGSFIVNSANNQNELNLFYEKYSKDFTDLALYYKISNFAALSTKDKISALAHKLKKEQRFSFASFLFDKLFTTFMSIEALANKIECLISMNKFENALQLNNIAFELFLETEISDNTDNIEKALAYQKAKIYFLSANFAQCLSVCENYIIKSRQKRFFTLLCATLIALGNFEDAEKLLKRFHNQLYNFLAEALIHMHSINQINTFIDFIKSIETSKINNEQSFIANIETLISEPDNIRATEKLLKQEIIFSGNTNKPTLITETVQCKE